ncbi:MAG: hypothetical protein ACYDCP_07040 [Thermoplasmataceae archaeon]
MATDKSGDLAAAAVVWDLASRLNMALRGRYLGSNPYLILR